MKKLLKKNAARLLMLAAGFALSSAMNVALCVQPPVPPGSTVGAPLDSGLLAVLLGAGALFFVIRKRKLQKEQ